MTAPFRLTDLRPGDRLRVIRGFTDFDGVAWAEGQALEYVDHGYFPYEGGYTFSFREGTLRLAPVDSRNRAVLRSPEEFFARVVPGS
jgi:hypothetical protein